MNTTTEIKTVIEPYLFFNGRCEEAIEFYRKALGAEVEVSLRFSDSPEPPPPGMVPEGWENKIMHATLRIGGATLMLSDGCDPSERFQGFSLSLTLPTEAEADRAFAALSEGGTVTMPMGKTFFAPKFGMVTDPFGVGWMITIPTNEP